MRKFVHIVVLLGQRGKQGILFIRRAKWDALPGKWQLPGGGVEKGETFLQASVRELKEETGIKSTAKEHHKLGTNANPGNWRIDFFIVDRSNLLLKDIKLSREHDAKRIFPMIGISKSKRVVFVKFGKRIKEFHSKTN